MKKKTRLTKKWLVIVRGRDRVSLAKLQAQSAKRFEAMRDRLSAMKVR
jgi:hypothetical protein